MVWSFPEGVLYVIEPSNHPGSKFSMTAVAKKEGSRDVKVPIKRSPDFKEFIHEGKWIAGSNSVRKLIQLAYYNIKK